MNTQTAGFAVLLLDAAIALFSFFVVAPCVLNAVSLFGVQKQFARTMIDEGVISEEAVQRLHPKKQIAGVIVSVVLVAVLGGICWRNAPAGYFCGGLPLIAGFLKYRSIVQFNSRTVQRFRNTYKDEMDTNKYNKYVDAHF